MDKEFM